VFAGSNAKQDNATPSKSMVAAPIPIREKPSTDPSASHVEEVPIHRFTAISLVWGSQQSSSQADWAGLQFWNGDTSIAPSSPISEHKTPEAPEKDHMEPFSNAYPPKHSLMRDLLKHSFPLFTETGFVPVTKLFHDNSRELKSAEPCNDCLGRDRPPLFRKSRNGDWIVDRSSLSCTRTVSHPHFDFMVNTVAARNDVWQATPFSNRSIDLALLLNIASFTAIAVLIVYWMIFSEECATIKQCYTQQGILAGASS
jgi:hypothetical protein